MAVNEADWNAFLESKKRFQACLKSNDWEYIPKIQRLKMEEIPITSSRTTAISKIDKSDDNNLI